MYWECGGGMSAIGHVNSLMPRFEQADDNDDDDGEGR